MTRRAMSPAALAAAGLIESLSSLGITEAAARGLLSRAELRRFGFQKSSENATRLARAATLLPRAEAKRARKNRRRQFEREGISEQELHESRIALAEAEALARYGR